MKNISLLFFLLLCHYVNGQQSYGANTAAGKYADSKGTKIYYEVYGTGQPVVLLHGSVYGDIDEYSMSIPDLEKKYKVIAIALRGHGKSELGTETYTYKLLAEDIIAVLQKEKVEKVTLIGFSMGAIVGYYLAANHPSYIKKLVALAGALHSDQYRPESASDLKNLTIDTLQKRDPSFVKFRMNTRAEPERYGELIEKSKTAWFSGNFIAPATAQQIQCPTLIIAGDRDQYFPANTIVSNYQQIPDSRLAIIPNAGHVDIIRNKIIFTDFIYPFLEDDEKSIAK